MSRVLTINAGSSSLRAAVFDVSDEPSRLADAHLERIPAGGRADALATALATLAPRITPLHAIVHRIVHGGTAHTTPAWITSALRTDLRGLVELAPDHLPPALDAIDATADRFPDVPQAACFDTAFHRDLPAPAAMVPLPRRFAERGVRRFGFHGLSCESVMASLRALGPDAARGRIVIAHLGNGASMTAVRDGRSVDTTMGFSPTGGLMMGTRTGDLDPGVMLYLLRQGLTTDVLARLLNDEAGLLGVSERSQDMRDLLQAESSDPHAADAVALFCHTARKALGSLIAVLGGLDTLVFTGGIGEHAAAIRARICADLTELGVDLNQARNDTHAAIISSDTSRTTVRVIATDEDRVLARHAQTLLLERPRDV